LEAGSIVNDVKDVGMLFDGEIIEFILNFIVDSFRNTVQAFAWPVFIVQFASPWGAIGLGLAYFLFPIFVKKHIEDWLFSDVEKEEAANKS
jgi:hypothetical protein